MRALFIANLELKSTEGIFKKVCAQSDAIGNSVGNCNLITRKGSHAIVKKYLVSEQIEQNCSFFEFILDQILNGTVGLIYIRHMIPNPKLVKTLKIAKEKGIKIYYEIPTYPYFGEQFKTSRKKYRAIVKIGLDIIFWPVIYHYIDKLVVIRSNSKARHFKKMIEITNGVNTADIKSKDYNLPQNKDVFSMVTVGTLYPYHGYDRILKGLAECNEKVGNITVEFHVVGSSQTIDDLHNMADGLGLKHVFFHGTKTTEELNEMYEKFDVGLGCLALHRRNADIDTTLKIVEYYCRGIPVVTSGREPNINLKRFTIKIDDTETSIDIKKLYEDYNLTDKEQLKQISDLSKHYFDWKSIMSTILKEEILNG